MSLRAAPFDRQKHVYRNDAFVEMVKDAIRFFNGTPVHPLPPSETFHGTGVYALYYFGNNDIYPRYAELNRVSYAHPIYVGKAVPSGWRQSRISNSSDLPSLELQTRLKDHSRSIEAVSDLELIHFACRFVIFEDASSDMIGSIEAALIKLQKPLWNSSLDGFGNHDPGAGRYQQAKSDWDVIHTGRAFADRCLGTPNERTSVLTAISDHLSKLG